MQVVTGKTVEALHVPQNVKQALNRSINRPALGPVGAGIVRVAVCDKAFQAEEYGNWEEDMGLFRRLVGGEKK